MRPIRTPIPLFWQAALTVGIVVVLVAAALVYVHRSVVQDIETNSSETVSALATQAETLFRRIETSLAAEAFLLRSAEVKPEAAGDGDGAKQAVDEIFRPWAEFCTKDRTAVIPFGVINGHFMSQNLSKPVQDAVWNNRDWFQAALGQDGKAVYRPHYVSPNALEPAVTISQEVFIKDGQSCGVIVIGILYSSLQMYLNEVRFLPPSYIVLCDSQLEIIVHQDKELVGKQWGKLGVNEAETAKKLLNLSKSAPFTQELNALWYKAFDGSEKVLRARKLFNGWYIMSITPTAGYYTQARFVEAGIILAGAFFAVLVCWLLVRADWEKHDSDNRNKRKSDFLAKMSHEIRTPMNAVIGMSELILRESAVVPQKVKDYTVSIKQAGTDLIAIINDILDFSKIESGRLKIVSGRYLLSSLIDDVVNIMTPRLREKSLYFIVFVDSHLPNNLKGDVVRIRQILLNLLSNAAKYTNGGYVSLSVTGVKQDGKHLVLNFAVMDTGIGIKAEDTDKIFEEFLQSDVQKNYGQEGTGLGLAITQNFVKLMGGEIQVSSTYGKGSIFTVTLPQEIIDNAPFAVIENKDSVSVLLYEPRTVYSHNLSETLDNLDVQYQIVTTEQDFLSAVQAKEYSLILISAAVYPLVRSSVHQRRTQSQFVLLSDSPDTAMLQYVPVLHVPVYSLPLANVLNHTPSQLLAMKSGIEPIQVRFRAPTARLLIVDDIKINLTVAQGLLSPFECHIDLAASGKEAVNLVKINTYDLILMDHMMPGIDGIETVKQIRKCSGTTATACAAVPIIAMTANVVAGMKQIFLKNGMNDFLPKPIDLLKLNQILAKWIPAEKQEPIILPPEYSANADGIAVERFLIPGLDTVRAVTLAGGAKNYLNILKTFPSDAVMKTEQIRSSRQSQDWKLYTTCVHGLRSALANVGSMPLSEQAERLTQAGRNGDMTVIENETETFLSDMMRLRSAVEEWLGVYQSESAIRAGATPPPIRGDLVLLKEALMKMDALTIHRILDELQSKPRPDAESTMLEQLYEHVIMFDFDLAAAQIDQYLTTH